MAEIQEFLTLYEGIEKLQNIEGTEDYKNAHEKVDNLLKKLERMRADSENKQYTSDSSTVCTLYKNLDSEGGELGWKLQNVNLAISNKEKAVFKAKTEQLEKMNEELGKKVEECCEQLKESTKQVEESRKQAEESRKQLNSLSEKHNRLMDILLYLHPEFAEMMRDPPGQSHDTQGANRQHGAQTSNAQSSQQQKPNAQTSNDQQDVQTSGSRFDQQQNQAGNDSDVRPISRSRSSSLSSSSSSNGGDQPGPSSMLSEVQPMSRSQSLSSLRSDDSDIEVVSKSQCR